MMYQRADPALVQGRHEQKHAHDRQREDVHGHIAGLLFLKRGAGPFVAKALGQNGVGNPFHSRDRLARAKSRRRLAGDFGRSVHVIMRNIDRPQGVFHIAQSTQGNLVFLAVEHVQASDVDGPGAMASLGLDDHLPDLAIKIEVVDIEAPQVGLQDREDVGDATSSRCGL